MPSPALADRAVAAAQAGGWVETEAPESIHDLLYDGIDQWLAGEEDSPAQLWLNVVTLLRQLDRRDAEVSACRAALAALPDQAYFHFRLAETLYRTGLDAEARDELAELTRRGCETDDSILLSLRLAAGRPEDFARRLPAAEAWFASRRQWGEQHKDFIRLLVTTGEHDRAAAMLQHHIGTVGFSPDNLHEMAMLSMHTGQFAAARALFGQLWAVGESEYHLMIGRFSGHLAPYDESLERGFLDRIETAFARTQPVPTTALPDLELPARLPRVVYVSFRNEPLPNDLAHHFVQSGRSVGLDISAYLDSGLTLSGETRVTDEEIARRLAHFEAEMERIRPDVILLDRPEPAMARGLQPAVLEALKKRLGFRLVLITRDSHRYAMAVVEPWMHLAEFALIFHPLSQLLEPGQTARPDKIAVFPVPAFYPRDPAPPERDLNLTFVGNILFPLRYALLSVLLTENLPVSAFYGEHRARHAPDMAAYWHLLERSRAVINVSAHTHDEHLITGRVWETVAAGALLVEQANPATECCFIPWRHYLPWETIDDVAQIARFVQRNPEVAARMAAEAQAWALKHFGARRFWANLLHRAGTALPQ